MLIFYKDIRSSYSYTRRRNSRDLYNRVITINKFVETADLT